ncbi:MAG: hypothetical protein Q7J03_01205 [Methanoregula sp.]|nr:hypothetical protein [Methanoregula sp.]
MKLNEKRWLLAGLVLLAGFACIGTVQSAPVTVFSDNFNDNSLDTAKWTLDVTGTNNAFWERNSRAEFQTYGPDSGIWHSYLNSKPILVNGWESIEITGRWTNNGYTSRTHVATVTDLDTPANRVSAEYVAWPPQKPQMAYYWNGGSVFESTTKPSLSLVPFRLKITRNGFEYYENNILKKSVSTSTMASSKRFQLQIGAWEYSRIISQTYIDDIVVQYTPDTTPPVTSAWVFGTPGPGDWYTQPVTITLTSTDNPLGSGVDFTRYSLDGMIWNAYSNPVTVSREGVTNFRYFSVDKAGNTEISKSLNLKIDTTPPTTTADYAGTSGTLNWYTTMVTVSLNANDGMGSGIKATSYHIGSGAILPYTLPLVLADEGTTEIGYYSEDNVGNIEPEVSDTIKIDTQSPDISVISPEERDYLQSDTLAIGFSATDTTSGIATHAAAIDGIAVVDGQAVDLTGLSTGEHRFTLTVTDNAGNTKTASRTFSIKPLPANINIDPDTLNVKSQSDKNAITVYIEIPGSDVKNIEPASVTLNYDGRFVSAQSSPTSIGDVDNDGIPDRMVKFNRQDVIGMVVPGNAITLIVNGKVNGDTFEGSDTIKVIGEEKNGTGNGKK